MRFQLSQFGHCEIEGFPSFVHTKIITDRLLLRPPQGTDFTEWKALRHKNEEYLKPFDPVWADDWDTPLSFQKRIQYQRKEWREDRGYFFFIYALDNNKLIGGININNVVRGAAQFGSLGYWIAQDKQGHGLMSEALDAAICLCANGLRLARINAATLTHNQRSQALLKRFSFERDGLAKAYLNINGTRQDHILYGLNLTKAPE